MKEKSISIYLRFPGIYSFPSSGRRLLFASVKKILLVAILLMTLLPPLNTQIANAATTSVTILVDDFKPQLFQGSSNASYFYNRLNGDRGVVYNSAVNWGVGQVKVSVKDAKNGGGFYESLNHPDRERLGIDFSAILPPQILPAFQSQIIGITVLWMTVRMVKWAR